MKPPSLSVYILAGGKSSRMGTDKGLVMLGERPMIDHILTPMNTLSDRVIIVSNNPQYEAFGVRLIPDTLEDLGPAGGILSALQDSETDLNLLVSCDMPGINGAAANFLIQHSPDFQIILPEYQGRIEPLFGIYKKECVRVWEEKVLSGDHKLRLLIQHFRTKTVNVDHHPLFQAPFFTNVNTPEDLENFQSF